MRRWRIHQGKVGMETVIRSVRRKEKGCKDSSVWGIFTLWMVKKKYFPHKHVPLNRKHTLSTRWKKKKILPWDSMAAHKCTRCADSNLEALGHKEPLLMIHAGVARCRDPISTVSHHLLRGKQQPLSFCLAAGTLKCIKFPLGDLKSVFSPVVAD